MSEGKSHLPATPASNDTLQDENEPQKIVSEPASLESSGSSGLEFLGPGRFYGPLASYHRGTALRMLTDYLSDLTTLNMSFDQNILKRVEENRSFLKELTEANQRGPNSPLTWPERNKLSLMLKDYQIALSAALEDEEDEEDVAHVADVEFKAENDVPDGVVPLRLYDSKFSGNESVESFASALDFCETQVREFKKLLPVVKVFRHQCNNLVESLEPSARNIFERCHKALDTLSKLEVISNGDQHGVSTGASRRSSVHFCFETLIGLGRNFQLVVDLFRKCADENLQKTALALADVPAPPLMPKRWSTFSLTIRNCEWSMDIVEFSFYTLEKVLAGASQIFQDVSFKWCEEKNRMVLQILGRQTVDQLLPDISKELETNDLSDLIAQLRDLGESASKWKISGLLKTANDRANVASFLSEKLSGPFPHARYLPWTFRVDPATLKFREYLDSGGAGMVARYSWYGENVAVKNVRSPGLTRHRFEEEAAILATVQHPNVVRLIGCGFLEKNKTGMLVMELMDHDLRTVIESRMQEHASESRAGPFTAAVAIDIILQIAQAMRHLKDHKVLHRDLKAKNILVNGGESRMWRPATVVPYWHTQEKFYVAKLADFGLAKCRPHSSWVRTRMAGTTGWRAPEVFHVPDTEVTLEYKWPADVYSFAMTCYEILTGKLPFAHLPNQAIHDNVIAGNRPEGLDELEIPDLLKDLVKKCWATSPDDRPTFEEIVKSLWECRVKAIVPVFERHIIDRHSSSSSSSSSASSMSRSDSSVRQYVVGIRLSR